LPIVSALTDIVINLHKVQKNNYNNINQILWDKFEHEQRGICKTYEAVFTPVDPHQIVGLSDEFLLVPYHGLRYHVMNMSGWHLWSGEYSEDDQFFKPHHIWHLMYYKPEVVKYLALEPGFRFLIDDKGYEDVWFDKSLPLADGD
jgi:hypothetical protein